MKREKQNCALKALKINFNIILSHLSLSDPYYWRPRDCTRYSQNKGGRTRGSSECAVTSSTGRVRGPSELHTETLPQKEKIKIFPSMILGSFPCTANLHIKLNSPLYVILYKNLNVSFIKIFKGNYQSLPLAAWNSVLSTETFTWASAEEEEPCTPCAHCWEDTFPVIPKAE